MSALLLLLPLLACGRPTPWTAPEEPRAVFPHVADYDRGSMHGFDVLEVGPAVCAECHGPAQPAGDCADCHDSYPHPDGFVAGSAHGVVAFADGAVVEACADCHERANRVASERYGCDSCHTSFPHPDGWAEQGQHGVWALARGSAIAACGSCHGDTLQGTATAAACNSCHETWPHRDGYADPAAHGADHAAGQDCLACHGTFFDGTASPTGGTTGVACARCHDSFPHAEGYGRSHPATASARGEGACMACHAPGDGPDRGPVADSCAAQCHGGAK